MTADRQPYSKCQILCAEREAWLEDEAAGSYYYDGISFWRSQGQGERRLVPSWRTPAHGWRHHESCTCDLCTAYRPAKPRPAAVV